MSFDRIARFVSGVDAILPYQQDRVAPLPPPFRDRTQSNISPPAPASQHGSSARIPKPFDFFTKPPLRSSTSASTASVSAATAAAAARSSSSAAATDSPLPFPLVAYQPLATFNVAYYHRVKVRYLFLFSLLTTAITMVVNTVYGIFYQRCNWYLLPELATSAAITVLLPALALCRREIAGRWYTTLAFSFLLGHLASFTWWSFSPSMDDILTSYYSLSPAVLLLCSYFLMNLSTALLFAVLTFAVEVAQSMLFLIGRPDIPNNVNQFDVHQVWLYLIDCAHVSVLFLLVFLLLHAWQQEHEGDLREAERLLVDTQRRAEQNNLNKSVFMSALAHDIRTPLNGIMAGLSLTLDDPVVSLSSEHRDYLQMAHSSASSLLYLLNDILDISRLDSCSLHFERVEFDLVETIERTVRSFALEAEHHCLQLMVDVSPSVPAAVRGDPVRLSQLLSNIVCNALKFSERGGAVSVSCEAVTLDSYDDVSTDSCENSVVLDVNKKSVRFVPVGTASSSPRRLRSPRNGTPCAHLLPILSATTARTGQHPNGRVCLHFAVKDEGCGIPADRLRSIFGRFEQASHDVAQLYAGRGLGLAIAAGLVRLFDGKIWCESVVKPPHDADDVLQQHGSTFHFLVNLDLPPNNNTCNKCNIYLGRLAEDDSSQPSSGSSPLSVRVRHLDTSAASSPAPLKGDESLLGSAMARMRRLASNVHSRSNSVAAQQPATTPTSAAVRTHAILSHLSAVSARLLSHATSAAPTASSGGASGGSTAVAGSPQLHAASPSVSVTVGEPMGVELRRELQTLRLTDSPVLGAMDGKGGRHVLASVPRSPSGSSMERRHAWQRWCARYGAVLVCIAPHQTRLTVAGWVREWHARKRAEGRGEDDKPPREPLVLAMDSEAQLMSSVSEFVTTVQLQQQQQQQQSDSPSSPRREIAAAAADKAEPASQPTAALTSASTPHRVSVSSSHTNAELARTRSDTPSTTPSRLLLVIDDYLTTANEPAAAPNATAFALAAAVGVGSNVALSTQSPGASPNLAFPSAARHNHLTRNRHAAKCLKMISSLLKARQCESELVIDVLFLLSAGSTAMRVDWPGLRYSGSMTSPASRLSLYRLMDAAATGADGGGGERTVVYRASAAATAAADRLTSLQPLTPRAPLLSLSAAATSPNASARSGSEQTVGSPAARNAAGSGAGWEAWQSSGGAGGAASSSSTSSTSRTSSPAPPHISLHMSRASDSINGVSYIPSSRSALAQPMLHSLTALQRKQSESPTARKQQAGEPMHAAAPMSPHRQQQQQQQQRRESAAADTAATEAEKSHMTAQPQPPSASSSSASTPRPRLPLLLKAFSSGSLSRSTGADSNEPSPVSARPFALASPVDADKDEAADTQHTEHSHNTAGAVSPPPLPPPPQRPVLVASSAASDLPAAATAATIVPVPRPVGLMQRSESLPAQPMLTRGADTLTAQEAESTEQRSPARAIAPLSSATALFLSSPSSSPSASSTAAGVTVSRPVRQPLPPPPASPGRSVSAPAVASSLGCVLVVDDNLINRKMAASVLKRMGLQSQLCESGEDAVTTFKHTLDPSTGQSRFVACLMDIRMPPGISGHECTRLIREWEKQQEVERGGPAAAAGVSGPQPRLPIFALTANVLDDDRQLAVQVGMDAYLEKPLNAALLKEQLTKFGIPTIDAKSRAIKRVGA